MAQNAGWTCARCGGWCSDAYPHVCPNNMRPVLPAVPKPIPNWQPISSILSDADIERIADAVVRKLKESQEKDGS